MLSVGCQGAIEEGYKDIFLPNEYRLVRRTGSDVVIGDPYRVLQAGEIRREISKYLILAYAHVMIDL